jgi:hypothetical protein
MLLMVKLNGSSLTHQPKASEDGNKLNQAV